MKTIWIKNDPLTKIISGEKTIEGRLNKGIFKKINIGESVVFSSKDSSCLVKIININSFNNFYELLKYDLKSTLPGINTINEGVSKYLSYYSNEKQKKYGVLGIHISVISNSL